MQNLVQNIVQNLEKKREPLCTCLISIWLFLDQISFKQRKSQNVEFISILFSFLLKKIWKYPKFFGEYPGTNQNLIAHVL